MYSPATTSQDSNEEPCQHHRSDRGAQSCTTAKFQHPHHARLSRSLCSNCSSSHTDSSTGIESQSFDHQKTPKKKRHRITNRQNKKVEDLPPVGIFWDIENCQVPRHKSAAAVVQRIRNTFLPRYCEAEFLVVCDVKKERDSVIQELHDSQVNTIHVKSVCKNAADEKLRQCLRRFSENHIAPACVILISGDVNFASDLYDLRYRKRLHVIVVHNCNVADALILCANEHYDFMLLMQDVSNEKKFRHEITYSFMMVYNLPVNQSENNIKSRLSWLSNNTGGRVVEVKKEKGSGCTALLRFNSEDLAIKAQKRLQDEDVFGRKITVSSVTPSLRNYSGRKVKGNEAAAFQAIGGLQVPQLRKFSQADAVLSQPFSSGKDTKRFPLDLTGQDVLRPIRGMQDASATGNERNPMELGFMVGGGATRRRSRTPQDGRIQRTSGSSDQFSDDSAKSSDGQSQAKVNQPVDLIISNLDPSINLKEMKRLLTNMFKEYTMILSLNVVMQADGTSLANLRVNNQQSAQFVISQLHRHKLGHKRIVINYAQTNTPDLDQLKAMVINMSQEIPGNQMPLFKFMELLESRYHCTVSISEMNKLKDICNITEKMGSRIISFPEEIKSSPPPNLSQTLLPYCMMHCAQGLPNLGWCELNTTQIPNVMMSLKLFSDKMHKLLEIHMGYMPLLSFQNCYQQECHEPLPVDRNGVPLEHLVSCVPNVEIKLSGSNKNIKTIKYEVKAIETDEEVILKSVPPSLAHNVNLLCREMVDLLKTTDRCQLLLSKFIPAYHHHFGRQCHVADYGYTRLIDLFESISHVVQIMGDGTRKIITLTHSAQMRRFTSDLLRVLKVQPLKQITITNFPDAYEKVMSKPFNAVDYGLCTFRDLLEELPENIVVITQNENNVVIAVPKREQTAKEIMRTKQFAMEVIDILRHSPYCTMLFNKFVPAYHHHFGHQCRVSDYGFSKLIELFEAIPHVVKIQEMADGERTVGLTLSQSLKVLGAQIVGVLTNSSTSSVTLEDLPRLYLRECGYQLKPGMYECDTVAELIEKLSEYVQIVRCDTGSSVVAVDKDFIQGLKVKVWALLLKPPYVKDATTFDYEYQSRYNGGGLMSSHLQHLKDVIDVTRRGDTHCISLKEPYKLLAELYQVLNANGGSVLFNNLDKLYTQHFGKPLKLEDHNIASVEDLYTRFGFLFFVGYKKNVVALNRNLAEYDVALPLQIYNLSHITKKWPPPTCVTKMAPTNVKKISPPKPDTPPSPDTNPWNLSRSSPMETDYNLSIQLPIVQNPKLLGNPYDLISPAHNLYSYSRSPWGKAPNPHELPMPEELLSRAGHNADDSTDSGVVTGSKLEISPTETEGNVSGAVGNKGRLATYLSFDN